MIVTRYTTLPPLRSFLGYQFTTYGWDVLTVTAQNPEDRADPMNIVFPKVTSCHSSGKSK